MKIIITMFLLIATTALHGQKDPDAEVYLDRIAKELDPGHALAISFDYIREDLQQGSTIEGEGSLVLMGERYKMDLGEAIVYFDGEKQYSLQTEIEEVYISKPDKEDTEFMFSDPIQLLRNYKEDFKYRLIGDAVMNGIPSKEIQLYPEKLGGPYALIKLFFSAENAKLNGLIIRHKDGILYTMIVTTLDRMDDPGTNYFKFDQSEYPNVDVIELVE